MMELSRQFDCQQEGITTLVSEAPLAWNLPNGVFLYISGQVDCHPPNPTLQFRICVHTLRLPTILLKEQWFTSMV